MAAKCDNSDAGKYFDRPVFKECIALEKSGYMACNGVEKEIIPGQRVMEDFEAEDELEYYYNDKERRLFFCLRFGRRRCE